MGPILSKKHSQKFQLKKHVLLFYCMVRTGIIPHDMIFIIFIGNLSLGPQILIFNFKLLGNHTNKKQTIENLY